MKITHFFASVIRQGFWGTAFSDVSGLQRREPSMSAIRNVTPIPPDAGLQLSAVWACVTLLAESIASLPLVVMRVDRNGDKVEARTSRLWEILRHQPNAWMTSHDFWLAMALNRFLRGNAYALVSRDRDGQLLSLTPLAADQMEIAVIDGEVVYQYYKDGNLLAYSADKILHWKGLGNGLVGLSTLEYMQATTTEMINAQTNASELYGNGRQLTGLLCIDQDLNAKQIRELKERYSKLSTIQGSSNDWLHVLPGDIKYQQIGMSAADAQLLETRKFGIDEIARWFGVPSALINISGGVSNAGLETLVDQFYRATVQPLCSALEQAIRQRVMTPAERADGYAVEFKMSALLRANVESRYRSYATALQNGFMTRNEVRRLENLKATDGADDLTAQTNLAPLDALGKVAASSGAPSEQPIKQ